MWIGVSTEIPLSPSPPPTHTHTYTHTHTHTYTHTYTHAHAHTYTYTQTHTHTNAHNISTHRYGGYYKDVRSAGAAISRACDDTFTFEVYSRSFGCSHRSTHTSHLALRASPTKSLGVDLAPMELISKAH